jgi:hypothetical protein
MPSTILPPELKLSIADFLDPISSLDYALTCKDHWKLCHTLLEMHTKRFAEAPVLASYDTQGVPTPCADGSSRARCGIWQTLGNILRDPKEGWYITEIDLISCWVDDNKKPPEEVPTEFLDAAMELMDLYPPLELADSITHESVNSYRSEDCSEAIVTRIFNDIKAGSPSGALAILIHHLPNLRTLRMTRDHDDVVFGAVIDQVAIEYSNTAKIPRLPFRRLKTVSLSHYDTEGCISVDRSLPFLRIPSLRIFAASMMGGTFRRKMRLPKAGSFQPESNVEEFFFSDCQFDARALEYMIAQTRSLKRFTYFAGGAIVDEALYDPKVILRALVKYAQNSLEHLILGHEHLDEEEVRSPSLTTSPYTLILRSAFSAMRLDYTIKMGASQQDLLKPIFRVSQSCKRCMQTGPCCGPKSTSTYLPRIIMSIVGIWTFLVSPLMSAPSYRHHSNIWVSKASSRNGNGRALLSH